MRKRIGGREKAEREGIAKQIHVIKAIGFRILRLYWSSVEALKATERPFGFDGVVQPEARMRSMVRNRAR